MKLFYILLAALLLAPLPGWTQSVVLDAELNESFEKLAKPIRPYLPHTDQTRFLLVADPTLNAFATPENLVFLHSGLIGKMQNEEELRGVIAHEMGHISHLDFLGLQDAQKRSMVGMLGGMVAGVGVAMAGAPQAASAILATSQAGGIANMMAHTRVQEQVADQTARKALEQAGISPAGMAMMFDKLRIDSQLSYDAPPPYLMTHPLPGNRAANLRTISGSMVGVEKEDILVTEDFKRLQAKVYALSHTPAQTLRTYTGNTFADRYARVLAKLKMGDAQAVRELLGPLEGDAPNDPWLRELRAQVAFMENNFADAETIWTGLSRTYPTNAILSYRAAEAAKAGGNKAVAMELYQKTVRLWPDWSEAWYGYGLLLGEQSKLVSSHLALAESRLGAYDKYGALESLKLARHYAKDATLTAQEQTWLAALNERLEDVKPQRRPD